jgi:hypothetical protein
MFLSSAHRGLVGPFEEQFGDSDDSGEGVWSELSKGVAANLSRSVFAVASFKGEYTACSLFPHHICH